MPERPILLLTNDDGIDAPGLRALRKAFARLGELWVVAPSRERSTSSHSLSLAGPVRIVRRDARSVAVSGTPADAVLVSLFGILPRPPALVVSGVNHGANLGTDVIYSGTVAAAREGSLRGIPSIAVSLAEGRNFARAARVAARIARVLLRSRRPLRMAEGRGLLVNVNVPSHGAGRTRVTRLGRRRYPETLRFFRNPYGDEWAWFGFGRIRSERSAGTDTAAVQAGDVSVTLLRTDQTLSEAPSAFADVIEKLEGSCLVR